MHFTAVYQENCERATEVLNQIERRFYTEMIRFLLNGTVPISRALDDIFILQVILEFPIKLPTT